MLQTTACDCIATGLRLYRNEDIALWAQLCRILDRIAAMKRGLITASIVPLKTETLDHFQGTIALYGKDVVSPSHHAAIHIAYQYERDEMVFDTLLAERLHQVPKGIGSICAPPRGVASL